MGLLHLADGVGVKALRDETVQHRLLIFPTFLRRADVWSWVGFPHADERSSYCGFLHSYSDTMLGQNSDSMNPNENENAGDRRDLMQLDEQEQEHEHENKHLLLTERPANHSKSSAQGLWGRSRFHILATRAPNPLLRTLSMVNISEQSALLRASSRSARVRMTCSLCTSRSHRTL